MSAGYGRHRANFYVTSDSSKKLWLYGLDPQARKLCVPSNCRPDCQPGQIAPPGGVLPVSQLLL
jgi:hypothetical protein